MISTRRFLAVVVVLFSAVLFSAGAHAQVPDACAANLPFGLPKVDSAHGQLVCHPGYAAFVDSDYLVPRWVAYDLTGPHTLGCNPRKNDFHPEDLIATKARPADYDKSGYDKGHQAPAEDFAWDVAEMHDSFSMSNMAPQLPGLNRQEWERLEETVRAWAWSRGHVWVLVGPVIPEQPKTIGADKIAVPTAFFKIVVDRATDVSAVAFVMFQRDEAKGPVAPFQVSIQNAEHLAGIDVVLPATYDIVRPGPLWDADLPGWRKAHTAACGHAGN